MILVVGRIVTTHLDILKNALLHPLSPHARAHAHPLPTPLPIIQNIPQKTLSMFLRYPRAQHNDHTDLPFPEVCCVRWLACGAEEGWAGYVGEVEGFLWKGESEGGFVGLVSDD